MNKLKVNSKISYLYRDAGNYRVPNEAVIVGVLSDTQIEEILATLFEGCKFIPSKVGFPEKTFEDEGYDCNEDDIDTFELDASDFSVTDEAPTVNITPEELVKRFQAHSGTKWFCTK